MLNVPLDVRGRERGSEREREREDKDLPLSILLHLRIRPRQIERVLRVVCSVARVAHAVVFAHLDLVLGDLDVAADVIRRLDQGGHEAGVDVPLDVAVEGPNAGVVGLEADDDVGVLVGHDGIALQWRRGDVGIVAGKGTDVWVAALDNLEVVAVNVPWVQVVVVVVDDDLNRLAVVENERIDLAVDDGVGRVFGAHGGGGVERGDFLGEVGDVVDDRSRNTIDVLEASFHHDLMIGLEDWFLIVGNKAQVVEEVEHGKDRYWREWFGFVVNEPAGEITGIPKVWNADRREDHIDIEGGEDGVIFACVRLRFDEEAPPLSRGKTDILRSNICLLGIDAIDLYNREVVTPKPDHYAGEVAGAYHVHQICLPGQHFDLGIRLVVKQTSIWNGSGDSIVRGRHIAGRLKGVQKIWHLLVVPVRHGQSEFFVILARERRRSIVHNKRCS